jgi:hypothetical protein
MLTFTFFAWAEAAQLETLGAEMGAPSTTEILARRTLDSACGQEVVDWAISMLEDGQETRHVLLLAATAPPFNEFELARLRDLSLEELGVDAAPAGDPVISYAAELLDEGLAGRREMFSALSLVKDLCIAREYLPELFDFYLLWNAADDLRTYEDQRYWGGATRENIDRIIRDRAQAFIAHNRA